MELRVNPLLEGAVGEVLVEKVESDKDVDDVGNPRADPCLDKT